MREEGVYLITAAQVLQSAVTEPHRLRMGFATHLTLAWLIPRLVLSSPSDALSLSL